MEIRVKSLNKDYISEGQRITALANLELTIPANRIFTLLGPSGCGKTTLLRCIVGLEMPDSGEITIGGEIVFSKEKRIFVPPEKRGLSMVFQTYAIWPHMNVFDNVAYPLQVRSEPKEEIRRKVEKTLLFVQLEGFEDWPATKLSGGQQQRVLVATLGLSVIQAQAILDMQLRRLTGLERQKIEDELAEVLKTIERLRAILASERVLMDIVVADLREVREKYADARRTEITDESGEFRIEDLVADEDMAITVTHTGYVKRTAVTSYRNQQRGGKGRIGMRFREEDFVDHLFIASTHAYLMVFSERGRAYWLKVHAIPDVGPDGKGKSIANLVSMADGEKIASLLAVKTWDEDKFQRAD